MKKVILSTLMFGALTVATTMPASAESKNTKQLNPWTDCGIGAMIFTSNGAAAAISNVIWDLGTTAVTSNMSSQNSCGSERAKTAMFIQASLPILKQEVAIGEGEYVTAMLELRGCSAESQPTIIQAIREDLISKPVSNAQELYNALENRVEASFNNSCASA